MSKTLSLLNQDFLPERNLLLVNCLKRAYQTSAECFAPEFGHDGMVYGLMVYKSATQFLTELSYSKGSKDWLKIILRSPRFLMRIGRYKIATYKVGDSLDIEPETAFPNNRVGAYQLTKANQAQRWLPFSENDELWEDEDISCTNLILAHTGNSEEGLGQVFIGIPSEFNEKQQITAWSTIFEIWRRGEGDSGILSISPTGGEPQAPTEKVAPPTLMLREEKKERKA